MTVILEPHSGDDAVINWWNWRPTVALLVRAGIVPAGERAERCENNGCGGFLSGEEALRAADYIDQLLARMSPGERILCDGGITDKPRDPKLPISEWNDEEVWNRYSAKYEVLQRFAQFCRRSGGFTVH